MDVKGGLVFMSENTGTNNSKNYGLMVIAASFLAYFVFFGYRSAFSVLLSPMTTDMGWDTASVTAGYSIMMLIYAVVSYFSGVIFSKFGAKFCFAIATITGFLGYFVTSFANTYLMYLLPYSIFAGTATGMLFVPAVSTIRSWFIGNAYGKAFGFAAAGACIAQVILTLGLKAVLLTMDWRFAMKMLGAVALVLLLIATLLTKKPPQTYNMKPKGEMIGGKKAMSETAAYSWTIGEAFKTHYVWGSILAFFCSCFSEFLIWSQLVNYWVVDAKMPMETSTNLYAFIGLLGCIFAPALGAFSDKYAAKKGNETKARSTLMFYAALGGVIGMLCLLAGKTSIIISVLACIFFAAYWQGMPGQVTGYMGSVFGKSFPQIWGLSTLIIMGIGPAVGSFLGAKLFDIFGSYQVSFIVSTIMFALSAFFALTLPKEAKLPANLAKKQNENIGA